MRKLKSALLGNADGLAFLIVFILALTFYITHSLLESKFSPLDFANGFLGVALALLAEWVIRTLKTPPVGSAEALPEYPRFVSELRDQLVTQNYFKRHQILTISADETEVKLVFDSEIVLIEKGKSTRVEKQAVIKTPGAGLTLLQNDYFINKKKIDSYLDIYEDARDRAIYLYRVLDGSLVEITDTHRWISAIQDYKIIFDSRVFKGGAYRVIGRGQGDYEPELGEPNPGFFVDEAPALPGQQVKWKLTRN